MPVPMSVTMVVTVTSAVMPVVIVTMIINRFGSLGQNRDGPQGHRERKEHRKEGHDRPVPRGRSGYRETTGSGKSRVIVMFPVSGLGAFVGVLGVLGGFRVMLRLRFFVTRIGVVSVCFLILVLRTQECGDPAAKAYVASLTPRGGTDGEKQRGRHDAEY